MKYLAVDELDLFLLFLHRGLYVEPDPHQMQQALPWAGPSSEADLERYAAQEPEIVASDTAPLDAWYASQRHPAEIQADKPRFMVNKRLLRLVDQISAKASPGWLSISTWLLEGDAEAHRAFGLHAAEIARRARADGKRHMATRLMGDSSGKQVLIVWGCPARGERVGEAEQFYLRYLRAKKHQTGAYLAACILFDPTGRRLLRFLYDNRPAGPDPELDADIISLGLVPVEEMAQRTRRSR